MGGPCLCAQPHSFMLLGLAVPAQLLDSESSCQLQHLVFFCCLLPDLRLWTQLLGLTEPLHHSLRFWPFWQQLLIVQAISCRAYQLPAGVQAQWMVESVPVRLLAGTQEAATHPGPVRTPIPAAVIHTSGHRKERTDPWSFSLRS